MQVSCSQCAAKYNLDDKQIAGHAKVQFRCSKCGHTNVVEVTPEKPAGQTQAVSPLPSFARAGKPYSQTTLVSQDQGLSLPADKTISISLISGPSKGLLYKLTKPRVVLGRSGADVEIDDPEVSRWHCAVEVKNDVLRLRDLDSTNGIFMNDERVRAAELSHLSEFRIGSTVALVTITPKHE